MASVDFDLPDQHVAVLRKTVRRSAHVQRAQRMLVAACLCSTAVVAVAGALLFQLL